MMKTIRDVVYAKTWLCAAVPIVLSAVLVVVTICFVGPVYATIDDARVLYVTAGYASGEPEGVYLFSNALWGQFLASLYGVVPSINWYFMYQILSVIYGCSIVGVTLMLFGRKLRAPLGIILSVHILFFVVMYQNAIMLIHFEVCAAMWGASGVGLLLLLDVASTRWQRVFVSALSAASMLLCYMQEENTFYASLVFYLLVTLFHLMSACFRFERGSRARIILSLGVTAGCVLVGTLSLAAYGSAAMDDRWADYLEYNPYRVAYWDYEHASYAEDPDVYEAAGWSEEFYEATQYMYFMDERFDAARLSEIVKPFNRLTSSVDESALTSIPKTLYGLFKAEVLTRWQALLGAWGGACKCRPLSLSSMARKTSAKGLGSNSAPRSDSLSRIMSQTALLGRQGEAIACTLQQGCSRWGCSSDCAYDVCCAKRYTALRRTA